MRCLVAALVGLSLLLPLVYDGPCCIGVAEVSAALHSANTADRVKLMQQSDYKKRVDQDRKARREEHQMGSVTAPETSSSGLDYAVLMILVASVVTLAFLANRRRRSRLRW